MKFPATGYRSFQEEYRYFQSLNPSEKDLALRGH